MKQKTLALQTLYREGWERLEEQGISDARIDAWYLLEYVTGISRASYYGTPDREITEQQAETYREYIKRRGLRIPLQHITGVQEFMGYTFRVNEHVLIPRQDTEVLVEEALKKLEDGMKVLDMCTGSGCILLSLLKMKKERWGMENLQGTGVDVSEEALKVAEENARNLEVSAKFLQSDLFEKVEDTYDVIVSNPPYIATKVIEELEEEVRIHDPYLALDGKEDGLYFYRRIIEEGKEYLAAGGCLLFEIGYDQADAVTTLLEGSGYDEIYVKKDLSGLDRIVGARYNKN